MKQAKQFKMEVWFIPDLFVIPKILWILGMVVLSLNMYGNPKVHQSSDIKLTKQILLFEKNKGQFEKSILFKALDKQAHYEFLKNSIDVSLADKLNKVEFAYKMKFISANENVKLKGNKNTVNPQFGARNYITKDGMISDVGYFKEIKYESLWNNIDALFHNSGEGMKYDFIVSPGGEPKDIKIALDGVKNLAVNKKGELSFVSSLGKLLKGAPHTYQIINGKKIIVASAYIIEKEILSFEIGDYNTEFPLIIDPIALKYATVLGNGEHSYRITTSILNKAGDKLYYIASKDSLVNGKADDVINIGCMNANGSAVLWTTTIYGIGDKTNPAEYHEGLSINVNDAGDVFASFYNEYPGTIGLNKIAQILGPHPAYPAKAGLGDPTNDATYQLIRLSPDGATLKYFTFLGGTDEIYVYPDSKFVVKGDKVYIGINLYDFSDKYLSVIPPTTGAINTITNLSGSSDYGAAIVCYNTAVSGASSIEKAAYLGDIEITQIIEDKQGDFYISGYGYRNISNAYQPEWSINPISAIEDVEDRETYPVIIKTDASLSTILYSSPVTVILPGEDPELYFNDVSIDLDNVGNLFLSYSQVYYNSNTFRRTIDINTITTPALKTNVIQSYPNLNTILSVGIIFKIPTNNLSKPAWSSIIPLGSDYSAGNRMGVDGKGRTHLLLSSSYNPIATNGAIQDFNGIPGKFVQYLTLSQTGNVAYGAVLGSSYEESISVGSANYTTEDGVGSLSIDKLRNTIYTFSNYEISQTKIVTPSYWDYQTMSQVNVAGTDNGKKLTLKKQSSLLVFNEANYTNTITDFPGGANTFCVGGQIYQDPNSGPINGIEPQFISGNGSLATHNIPDLYRAGIRFPHPIPKSPKIAFQWQRSEDGGTTWGNIVGENKAVLKPEPYGSAGTIQFRRLGISGDTIISNTATAIIAGTFNLQINGPTDPTYYCAGLPSQSLGVTVTGASGNITWQWYDGFTPVGNTIISPASGSGAQGTFSASVGSAVTKSGFYRLVVIDAGGCRKEYFASIQPLTAKAFATITAAVCPGGTGSIRLGPISVNPLFDYRWAGPSSFTSSLPNPVTSTGGKYYLEVKLKTQSSFCAGGKDSVDVVAFTAHDVALVNTLTEKGYCQSDGIDSIGLNNPAPASGYNYSWAPSSSLSSNNTFRTTFNPQLPPFKVAPLDSLFYVFNATRNSDGCIFSDTLLVRDTILAVADASLVDRNIEIVSGCSDGSYLLRGGPKMEATYFEWEPKSTTFPGGLAALLGSASFGVDKLGSSKGAKKQALIYYPQGNYEITFTLKAAYFPIGSTRCIHVDSMKLIIACGSGGFAPCTVIGADNKGINGACSQKGVVITAPSATIGTWNSVVWTTKKVNNVLQPANTVPKGLYTESGASLASITGNHPEKVTVNIEDGTWGWSTADSVIYQFTATSVIAGFTTTCTQEIKIFSGSAFAPPAKLKDTLACFFPTVANGTMKYNANGKAELPLSLTNANYSVAPSGGTEYNWERLFGGGTITGASNNRFPTLSPTTSAEYKLTMRDSSTGCITLDTLSLNVVKVEARAGANQITGCQGSIVKLGTDSLSNHTYKWTPSAGLFYPITGSSNDSVAEPFTIVPSGTTTFNLITTEITSGCQATDLVVITSNAGAPAPLTNATILSCKDKKIGIGPGASYVAPSGATIVWTATGGSANLSWLSSTTVLNPEVQMPAVFSTQAIFTLTITKGSCGTTSATYTIDPVGAISAGVDVITSCTPTLVKIGASSNITAYNYKWFPQQGLFTDNLGATKFNNLVDNLFEVYARPSEDTDYTLLATHKASGCIVTDIVKVSTPAGLSLSLNDDITYCPGSGNAPLIGTGTGSNPTWTVVSGGAAALGYLSSTSAMTVNFSQTIPVPGVYVYRLTLDGTGGCTISDDIKVTVYEFSTGLAGGDVDVCEGTPTQLGTKNIPSAYNFNWSVVSPLFSANLIGNKTDKNPTVLPLVKTIYEVTYSDAVSGCATSERVIVTPIPKLTINTLATSITCGEIVGLNVTSLVQRLDTVQNPTWYKDFIPSLQVSSPSSFSTNKNTTFYVVGQNQFGCVDTGRIVLDVEPVRKPVIVDTVVLVPNVSTINLNDYLPLSSSVSTGTLAWYTSSTGASGTQVTSPLQSAGTYYCIEKTAAGCVSPAARLSVVPPNPILRAEFSCNTTCSNFDVGLDFIIKNNDFLNVSTGLAFTVNLPAGLTVGTNVSSSTCGGIITAVAGASAITFTGGSAGAGAECIVSIPISGVVGGPYSVSSANVTPGAGLDNGIIVAQTVTVTASCAGQGPGKPLNLVVNQDGNMSWSAPQNLGSGSVVDYLIEYSTNGGTSWQTFNDGISNAAATYFNIVDPTLTYQFRITAINSFGSGCSALLSPTYSNLSNCSGPFACAGNINVLLRGDCSKTVSVQELLLPCGPIGYTVKVNDGNPTNGGIVDGISPVGGWLYGIFDQNGALVCKGRIVSTDGSGPVMSANQLAAWNAIDTIVTWADNLDEIYNVPSSWWGNNVGYSSIPVFGSKYYTGRPYMVDSCELVGGVNPSSDTWIIDADDNGLESMNDKWDIHRSRNLQVRVTDYLESPQGTGNGYHHLLRRTFQFTDQRGNSAFLNQIIYFQRPAARGSFANRFEGIATPGANPQTPLDRGPGNLGQFGPFGSGPRKAHSSYGEADNKDLNKANIIAFSYATTLGADQMTTPYGMGGQMLRDTIVYDISNGNCYNFNAASEMKKLLTGIYVALDTLPSGAKDSVSLFSDQLNSQFSASFSYKEFPACNNGKNYEVVTTVFDWNTGAQSFDTLIIQMLDKSAPVFAAERAALPILGSSSSNPILVSVGTNDCTGSLRLGNASNLRDLSTLFNLKVTDNCSALTAINLNYAFETKDYWNQLYYVPQGSYTAATYTVVNTGNVPTVIGLPIGQHKVTITANDGCNNQSTQVLYFDVIDNVAPVMKCDDALTVSLTSNSSSNYYIDANKSDADLAKQMQARLYVADINEGSRDNCTLDSLYVRRQFHKDCLPYFALNMEYDIYGNTPNGKVELNDFDRVGTTDLYYTPKFMQYVDFFCCDPSTVMVELWGSDARHYNNVSAGNWNYCWTNVTIEDKTAPVITAPVLTKTYNSSNQYKGVARPVTNWVNCTDKEVIGTSSNTDGDIANEAASNLLFGYPDIYGLECKGSVAYSVTKKLTCDTGTITRRWVVTKEIGDGKIITVRDSQLIHVRANHNFSITVPVDQSATCSVKNGTDLILDEVGCDLLAVSYSETKYDAAPGDNFCYKIYRTATVINWCMLPNHFSCAAADPGAYAVTIPRNTGTAAVKYTFTLGSANTGRSQTALEASTAGSSVLVKGGAIAAAGESLDQGTTTASGFISPATTNCFTKPGFAFKYTQIIKVTDEVKPTVASGTAWTPATAAADVAAGINWNKTKNSFSIAGKSTAANSCLAKVKLSFAASDACATNDLELEKTELLRRGTDVAGTGTVVTGTAASTTNGLFTVELSGVPVGEYDLRVTVRDDCGNVTVSRLAVDVEDNKAPAPVCVQNLTATLMPNGTGGCMVVVAAKDVFQDINRDWTLEECTPGAVKAEIVKLTNGVEGAKAATLTLTSADKGIVTARVYLTDAAGNADFCTVTINVEDNFCGNGTVSAAVTGAIQTESKVTVEGVQVNLSGQTQKSFATGVNGLFVFNNLTAGADYTVTPSLNKGFLNGVSTYDLILISKHILGVQPLNTPYKLIAADVNNSKSVTTLDLIQLRKLILNIDATFANNSSWRFVDASYTFPNASNPWAASFPEVKNVNDLVGSLSANFVAVKVGDVNGNAIANSTQGSVRNLTSNLGINVADMNMVAGNEYKVDFTAADLNGIEGFQFTLNLDKKGLELVDLVPGIAAEENFGIFTEEGVITASWNGEAKGGVLFSLVVRAKSNTTLSEVLNLNSRYTAAEAYKGGEVMNVGLNFNASKASANYELYQNTPNPFAGQTIIGFNLPAAGTATLTIQDVTGRTLKVINGQYAKGYNQVTVKDRDLSTKGVLTYTLKVADFTMTKKMVIVE